MTKTNKQQLEENLLERCEICTFFESGHCSILKYEVGEYEICDQFTKIKI